MASSENEDELLRSVALKNAGSIHLARLRAEEELREAKAALEAKTAELARSLSLMAATLEATDDAILVTDGDAHITHFNDRFRRMWDLPADVLATRRHWNVLEVTSQQFSAPDEFLDRVRKIYDSSDEVIDVLLLRDSRVIERFSKIQYADDVAVGRVWSFRDISVRKRAEELRARLAAIVESSDDAIVSKTLDGIVTTWNRGAERIFGYSAAEIVGKPVTTLFPPDRLDEEQMILERLKKGAHVEHYETVRVRKGGGLVNVSLTVSPVRDESGKIVGASKIARDISRQKRQEAQLKASEERLRTLVEATPECVKVVAPDGSLEFMNRAGLRMIECEDESRVVGGNVIELIAPDHRDFWAANHRRICAGESLDWEFEIVGKHGTRRWMETHAVPLPHGDDGFAQLAVTRDITGRKNFETEREELLQSERSARAAAEHASLLKDEFLATLSHELRTPLNAILGWSQILSMGKTTPEDLQQGVETIERNARAQARLIEDLLDMSRIISGKVRLDVQWTDVSGVVTAAADAVRPAIDAKGIRLRMILDPLAGPVVGDPTRLQQVVWNLLSNAIKFTAKGGKIDVVLERVNSHLEIMVHDSGTGIKPEFLPVIFERFRQVDSSTTRAHGGLGLGLSIVKSLVELHGGTVTAKSGGEGQGSTFTVVLPLAPVLNGGQREHPTASKAVAFEGSKFDLAGIKVLVVDDEADAGAIVKRVLLECHAEVTVAACAADALALLDQQIPDVIVSDIGMPGMDGYQLIRQIRSLPAEGGGKTPALALTAFARSEDRTRAVMAGYQMHMSKPVEPQELIVAVGSLAGRNFSEGSGM